FRQSRFANVPGALANGSFLILPSAARGTATTKGCFLGGRQGCKAANEAITATCRCADESWNPDRLQAASNRLPLKYEKCHGSRSNRLDFSRWRARVAPVLRRHRRFRRSGARLGPGIRPPARGIQFRDRIVRYL